MSRRGDQAGTFELLAKLPGQFITLAKVEFENAKREISARVKRAGIGLLSIIVALFFLFFALGALVAAAIAGIAVAWPVWLAALTVGVGLILLAVLAILGGIMLMKRGVPLPKETMSRLEGDLDALGEVKFNASAHASHGGLPDDPGRRVRSTDDEGGWR